jgi:hypothetical protein
MKTLVLAVILAAGINAADLTYTETTQLTGGSMKGMINLAARFGGTNLSKGVTSTVVVSGNRMAQRSGDDGSIIDLDQGTMTDIDYKGKKYSVITFAELAAAMEKMPQTVPDPKTQNKDADVKTNIKVTSDNKGAGPSIAGTSTNLFEVVAVTTTEVTDKKKGNTETFTSTLRMEEAIGKPRGWEAFRDFYRAMATKMAFRPDSTMQMMRQMGLTVEAMDESGKKLAAMDGMNLRSVVQMIGPGEAMPGVEMPSAKEAARSAISGITGGIGGFGKRKKEEPKAEEKQAAQPAGPNILLEMTTLVQTVQPGVANPQAFNIPGDFKQQEHPFKRYAEKK